jgi:hypothetical protein
VKKLETDRVAVIDFDYKFLQPVLFGKKMFEEKEGPKMPAFAGLISAQGFARKQKGRQGIITITTFSVVRGHSSPAKRLAGFFLSYMMTWPDQEIK